MKKTVVRNTVLVVGLLVGLGASGLAQTPLEPPAHPVTAEQVRQLMATTHAMDRMNDSIHKMIAQQKQAMPFFPDAFWTDFEAEFAKLDWVAIATPIYQKYLSQEDADKAIAFYQTSAGQHALDASMSVYNDMAQAGFERGKEIGQRLGEKYQEQIMENMKKARQSQAPSPENK